MVRLGPSLHGAIREKQREPEVHLDDQKKRENPGSLSTSDSNCPNTDQSLSNLGHAKCAARNGRCKMRCSSGLADRNQPAKQLCLTGIRSVAAFF